MLSHKYIMSFIIDSIQNEKDSSDEEVYEDYEKPTQQEYKKEEQEVVSVETFPEYDNEIDAYFESTNNKLKPDTAG